MKLADLRTAEELHAESMRDDPQYRREWERTALAHAVALRLVEYRAAHTLSQRALARQLGMPQPAIARLEAGEHNPTIETLLRLSRGLGIAFHLDVTPAGVELTA